MKKSVFLLGSCIAASIDIACGLGIVWLLNVLFHHPASIVEYGFGVFFAVLPDLDALPDLFSRGSFSTDHRDRLHQPLLLIGVITLIGPFLSLFWMLIAILSLLAHFLHDSTGISSGWGIKWFTPFSENQYHLFGIKNGARRFLVVWTTQELEKIEPLPVEEWLKRHYLRPTFESVSGVFFLIFGSILALTNFF